MSILSADQRAVIQADTKIDPLIVDRVVEGYDALLLGHIDEYSHKIATAMVQQGLPIPTPQHERPTAVDKMKTICIHAIADQKRWSYQRTARWLVQITEEAQRA